MRRNRRAAEDDLMKRSASAIPPVEITAVTIFKDNSVIPNGWRAATLRLADYGLVDATGTAPLPRDFADNVLNNMIYVAFWGNFPLSSVKTEQLIKLPKKLFAFTLMKVADRSYQAAKLTIADGRATADAIDNPNSLPIALGMLESAIGQFLMALDGDYTRQGALDVGS